MRNQKGLVLVNIHILSRLVAASLELAKLNRTLQVRGGIEKTQAVPGRRELQELDHAANEVNLCLVSGQNLTSALDHLDRALGRVTTQIRTSAIKSAERPIKVSVPRALPEKSKDLFYAIGKQGVSNALSLSTALDVAMGTISKNVEVLLLLRVVERRKHKPVIGKRNWAYVYQLTPRGQKLYFELFNEWPNLYDYKPYSERYKHHVATNLAIYFLRDYESLGAYFGHDGKYTEVVSNYCMKSLAKPDTAGYWSEGLWRERLTFVEVETGNDYFSFGETVKKYMLSTVTTLMVVLVGGSLFSTYKRIANSVCAEGEYATDEPLEVFAITLQDLVDGLEPELIATRNRGKSTEVA